MLSLIIKHKEGTKKNNKEQVFFLKRERMRKEGQSHHEF